MSGVQSSPGARYTPWCNGNTPLFGSGFLGSSPGGVANYKEKQMDDKKRNKYIANAEEKFQKEQLQAAAAMEQINKSAAIIDLNKDELTKEQLDEIYGAIATRRQEVSEFLMSARDKYALKLKELGDPTLEDILDPEDLV
jgi:hypothetical protein